MKPDRVVRENVSTFTDLPNIGPASARDFALLGFAGPHELAGADPLELYHALCRATASYQHPCVLDVFMSVTDFLAGNPARPWWDYTEERKKTYRGSAAGLNPDPHIGSAAARTCAGGRAPERGHIRPSSISGRLPRRRH